MFGGFVHSKMQQSAANCCTPCEWCNFRMALEAMERNFGWLLSEWSPLGALLTSLTT